MYNPCSCILTVVYEYCPQFTRYLETTTIQASQRSHSPPLVQSDPITLPANINLLGVMATFPKYTSPGPSGMQFQHLINVASVHLPTSICSTLHHVVNLLAAGKVPQQVSKYMAGASIIALTKEKPNCAPDIHPIAVNEVLRRLVGKCQCLLSREKAANFFQPFQYGVACLGGAEKIIHKVRQCVDNHWLDSNFALLKVDMTNTFNLVSRQTFLEECSKHFLSSCHGLLGVMVATHHYGT